MYRFFRHNKDLSTLLACAGLLCISPADAQSATTPTITPKSVMLSARTTTWSGGVIPWKYNPASQPAILSTDAWLALITRTMAQWEKACQVHFAYQGLTSTPTIVDDGVNVVGWSTTLTSYGAAWQYARGNALVPEDVVLLSPSDLQTNEWWTRIVRYEDVIEGVLLHELGHLLGLQHSDQPASVLYANPYHPEHGYMRQLRPDDRAGCAALYGAMPTAPTAPVARGPIQLAPGESARVVVAPRLLTADETASEPSAPTLAGTTAAATLAGFVSGMPMGKTLRVELLTPDGSLYDYREYPSFPRGRLALLISNWATGYGAATLPGRWTVNVLVGDVLKATQSVDITASHGSLTRTLPDALLTVRPGTTAGSAVLSTQALSGTIASYSWAFNGVAERENTDATVTLTAAPTDIQLRIRSDQPRYVTASNGFAQGEGPDVVRRVTLRDTTLSGPTRFASELLGTRNWQTLLVSAWTAQSGTQNIYVAALVGNTVLVQSPSGWSAWDNRSPWPARLSVVGPALVQFAVVQALDLSSLPPGTPVFVGSGSSFNEMVSAQRYQLVGTL